MRQEATWPSNQHKKQRIGIPGCFYMDFATAVIVILDKSTFLTMISSFHSFVYSQVPSQSAVETHELTGTSAWGNILIPFLWLHLDHHRKEFSWWHHLPSLFMSLSTPVINEVNWTNRIHIGKSSGYLKSIILCNVVCKYITHPLRIDMVCSCIC